MRRADPEFYTLIEMLRENQASGNVALRLKKAENQPDLVMVFRKREDAGVDETTKEVRRILGVKADANEFRVVYGAMPTSDEDIALLTRSIIEILSDISSSPSAQPCWHSLSFRKSPIRLP